MGNLGSERQQCKDPPLEWGRPRHGPNAGAAARSRRYWYVDTLEYAAINRCFVCHYSTYTRAPREEWRPLTAILYRRRTINWKYRVNNPLPATFQDAYKSNIKQLYCFFSGRVLTGCFLAVPHHDSLLSLAAVLRMCVYSVSRSCYRYYDNRYLLRY